MESRFLRIAYTVQFVLTLLVIFEIWAQTGGQVHLDLVPWYAKLALPVSLAFVTVKATAASVKRDRFWNRATAAWMAVAFGLIVAMGVLSYYEHLHEPADEDEDAPAHVDLSLLNGQLRQRAANAHLPGAARELH